MATVNFYNSFFFKLGSGTFNLTSDAWKIMLFDNTFVYDRDAHDFEDDLIGEHAGTGGYTTGGIALTSESWTQDNANDRALWDFDDFSIPNSTLTVFHAVVVRVVGSAATNDLMCNIDFGGAQTTTNAEFVISLATGGLFAMNQP